MDNILIVGDYGTFVNELINKFSKENWPIYMLVNNKKNAKPSQVFEQYSFSYDSNSIKDILSSCRPDVILFTGAYDSAYQWDDETVIDTSLNYITGLSNLLMCAALVGIRHFIYVSSDQVYEDEYIVDIKEDMPTSPNSYKAMAISQGENLAMHFNQTTHTEVTVVRVANLYGIPKDRRTCNDICSRLCLEALDTGRIKVNAKKIFSALYVRDAVEGLFKLINSSERSYHLYHISSMEEISEEQLARLIQEVAPRQVDIIDRTIGLKSRKILSNERFCSEFPFEIKNQYKDIIRQLITYMNGHKSLFFGKKKYIENDFRRRIHGIFIRIVPFVESLIFFIPFFIINNYAETSPYLEGINFYILYVLLFAVVHGRQQAIFTSLLSVIGYSLQELYTTSGFSLLIDIKTYVWIAKTFMIGLTVGHLKDKFREMEADKNERIDFLTERIDDIRSINSSNIKIKNYFQDKIISSTESIGRIYDITSRLDTAAKGEVIFAAMDTLSEIMGSKDISIYLVSNQEYCRLAAASSERARYLGKSIKMNDYKVIFDTLRNKQIFINRSLDDGLPMMASALFDNEANMKIVILLWDIPYEQMTLYQANLLTVVGSLIYHGVVRDANYLEALAYQRFVPDTKILQETAFDEMLDIYTKANEKGYAEISVINISCESHTIEEMNDTIIPLLRDTDYVGLRKDGNLAVLLTNTNANEAVFVRKRLEDRNIKTYVSKES